VDIINNIPKVRRTLLKSIKTKSGCRYLSYTDVPSGWVSIEDFLPNDYDLLLVKTKSGRIYKAWLSHNIWDGLKIKQSDTVEFWKNPKE
jgi:hypothetical protein